MFVRCPMMSHSTPIPPFISPSNDDRPPMFTNNPHQMVVIPPSSSYINRGEPSRRVVSFVSHPAAEGFQRLARQDETQEIQVVASLARDKWDIPKKMLDIKGDTDIFW